MTEEKKIKQHTYKRLAFLIVFVVLIVGATSAINSLKKHAAEEEKKISNKDFYGNKIKLELRKSIPYIFPSEGEWSSLTERAGIRRSSRNMNIQSVAHLLLQAEQDMENGDFSAAEDKLRTALVFHGRNIKLHALLGKALYQQEKYKEAEAVFRQQAYLDPDDTTSLNNLGTALAKQKKYNEAIATLLQLIKCEPKSPSALINLAGLYAVSGDRKNAIFYFQKAYELLGYRILLLAESGSFAALRQEKEFIRILEKARKDFLKNSNADASEKTGESRL